MDFGFIPPRSALQIVKGITGGPSVADAFTVTISGPNQFLTTTTIAVGMTRTITNLLPGFSVQEALPPPPNAPAGYTWAGNLYAPNNGELILQAELTGTVNVTNTLLAQPPGAGTLSVTKVLSWFNVAPPLTQTFQITISGPSFPGGQQFSIMSGTLGITNLIPGTYIVTETLPGNGWATTYTVDALNTTTNAVITVTNDLTSTLTSPGNISGQVYDDLNMNGVNDIGETGVASVTVRAYDRDGVLRGSATTNASGNYTLAATGNGPYRVEFSGLPQGYVPSLAAGGGATSDVSVQEITSGGATGVDFAAAIPALYCQNNPDIAAVLCNNGAVGGNSSPALVSFPSTASGTSGINTTGAPMSQIGTAWGIAYQRTQRNAYVAASVQRHKGLGPRGEDGVYVINYSGGTPVLAAGLIWMA